MYELTVLSCSRGVVTPVPGAMDDRVNGISPRVFSVSERMVALMSCLVALASVGPTLRAAETDTTPKVVKIPALIEAIKQHKGKVVVVDCWADG